MTTQNHSAILGLWAQTPIHAGDGRSVDGIDLPIQREAHNGWPCVYGSAIKGALREKATRLWQEKPDQVRWVFGSEGTNSADHAGALKTAEARLLLLPVRSLTGYFKWVTCPALLQRLQRDAQRLGMALSLPDVELTDDNAAWVVEGAGDLFLEEYRFTSTNKDLSDLVKGLVEVLSQISGIDQTRLNQQLVVLSNDSFSHFTAHHIPVTAHIALDNQTKTVKPGALWYQETLPTETVLYCALSADDVRDASSADKAEAVLSWTHELFKKSAYLQIGGNETVGMGWCQVQWFAEQNT